MGFDEDVGLLLLLLEEEEEGLVEEPLRVEGKVEDGSDGSGEAGFPPPRRRVRPSDMLKSSRGAEEGRERWDGCGDCAGD